MNKPAPAEQPVTAQSIRQTRATAAMRMVLNFLLEPPEDRSGHAANLARDLSEDDRIRLLWLFMDTFPGHIAEQAAQAFFEGVGYPGASIMEDPREDAKFWAGQANPKEVDAFAMACFNRMSKNRRHQFLQWATGTNGPEELAEALLTQMPKRKREEFLQRVQEGGK